MPSVTVPVTDPVAGVRASLIVVVADVERTTGEPPDHELAPCHQSVSEKRTR